jgi:N-terminal domain of toast_rack, DUF2154/Domain of unknown function (DUF5668)/Cell wall-active antibiotics response 4TMS YvqF
MASQPAGPPRRPRSFVGPVILICLGVFFLLLNLYPEFDPWPWLFRYWPLILIAIGLGKIWDSYYAHQHPERATAPWFTGTGLAWVILLLLFVLVLWHGRLWHDGRGWRLGNEMHETQSVDQRGAKLVTFDLEFPAGRLDVSGGSGKLLDADFRYDRSSERPNVDYSVSGGNGHLTVSSRHEHVHWGPDDNDWDLKLGGDEALDMNVNIGAGEGYLRLGGLEVEHLKINMGAGRLDLDLTGPRKANLDATIEGGVGSAIIRLPKDVGVRVEASGGIGSVSTDGLRREGGAYQNDAYGKTPTNIDMTVHGGIGEINLMEQ